MNVDAPIPSSTPGLSATRAVVELWRRRLPGLRLGMLCVFLFFLALGFLGDVLIPDVTRVVVQIPNQTPVFFSPPGGRRDQFDVSLAPSIGWPIEQKLRGPSRGIWTTLAIDLAFVAAAWCGAAACGMCLLSTHDYGGLRRACGLLTLALTFTFAVSCIDWKSNAMMQNDEHSSPFVLSGDGFYLAFITYGVVVWPVALGSVLASDLTTTGRTRVTVGAALATTAYIVVACLLVSFATTATPATPAARPDVRAIGRISGPVLVATAYACLFLSMCAKGNGRLQSPALAAALVVAATAVVLFYGLRVEASAFETTLGGLAVGMEHISIAAFGAVVAFGLLSRDLGETLVESVLEPEQHSIVGVAASRDLYERRPGNLPRMAQLWCGFYGAKHLVEKSIENQTTVDHLRVRVDDAIQMNWRYAADSASQPFQVDANSTTESMAFAKVECVPHSDAGVQVLAALFVARAEGRAIIRFEIQSAAPGYAAETATLACRVEVHA